MSNDRGIQQAIEAGEKNRRTIELVHNWCIHAKIEKMGGTGLIEAQTGLPIGHHAMVCEHASAAGMATWDIADAALDFHDRNCVDCKQRVVVRLPNLSSLISERERELAEQKRVREAQDEQIAVALTNRQVARQVLRDKVPLASQTIIDQLEELDHDRNEDQCKQLVETAKLAPEIFTAEIIEHYFILLETPESWFSAVGLETLSLLKTDSVRLARCALIAMRDFNSIEIASRIILEYATLVDVSLIPSAFRSLVFLANPPRHHFSTTSRPAMPEPLLALYRQHPAAIKAAIQDHLDSKQPSAIEAATNAITIIAQQDKLVALPFVRPIIAMLTRPELLIEFDDHSSDQDEIYLYRSLQDVLESSLKAAPHDTDKLVVAFMATANSEAKIRLLKAYEELFHPDFRVRDKDIEATEVHSIALRRLIDTATSTIRSDDIWHLLGMFRSAPPRGLEDLVRREASYMLGAAILLDEQRIRLGDEYRQAKVFLDRLDYNNKYSSLVQLQKGLVNWVANVAAESAPTRALYLQVLSGIPDQSHHLRGIMITALSRLMSTIEGLNIALPPLYSALVGASQQERAAAIKALKKLSAQRRKDLPLLLYEAFMTTLRDPYVIVHQTAVRALEGFSLPDEFTSTLKRQVRELILLYSHSKDDDDFLLDCILLYVSRYIEAEKLQSDFGAFLVSQLSRMKLDMLLHKNMEWHSNKLSAAPGFGAMVISLLKAANSDYQEEPVIRILQRLDPVIVYAERKSLEGIALERAKDIDFVGSLVELLTRAGAWEEAESIAKAAKDIIPDTTRNLHRRLFADLLHIATKFELAIAGNTQDGMIEQLGQQWFTTIKSIDQDNRDNEERRDPLRGFLGKN